MSDSWITLVPKDPLFVPHAACCEAAAERFAALVPAAESIDLEVYEHVTLFDCGENLVSIRCLSCGKEIDLEWWRERMDEDYSDGVFKLEAYDLPCCGLPAGLDTLVYDWPQAFGRFGLAAMNPGIAELKEEQIKEFEELLATPLHVIYQRI